MNWNLCWIESTVRQGWEINGRLSLNSEIENQLEQLGVFYLAYNFSERELGFEVAY